MWSNNSEEIKLAKGLSLHNAFDGKPTYWDRDEYKYVELRRQLNENEEIYALLTAEEGAYFLYALTDPNPYKLWKNTIFGYTDFMSNFAGNINDSLGVIKLIVELKSIGIVATEYVGKDGNRYIKLSGDPSVRKYLSATRYLINDKKILAFGIGSKGLSSNLLSGAKFGIVFSGAYRAIEWLFKDEYDLVNFFVNITMDMAKLIVATIVINIVGPMVVGSALLGGKVIVITAILLLIGIGVTWFLYNIDEQFKISETIIKNIKSYRNLKPESYHPDQFFNQWAKFSHG